MGDTGVKHLSPVTKLGSKPRVITSPIFLASVLKSQKLCPRSLLWAYASIPAYYLLRNLQRPPTYLLSSVSFPSPTHPTLQSLHDLVPSAAFKKATGPTQHPKLILAFKVLARPGSNGSY